MLQAWVNHYHIVFAAMRSWLILKDISGLRIVARESVQKKTMQGILLWCFTGETMFLSLIRVVRYKKHAKIQGICSIRRQRNLRKNSSLQGWIIWESNVSPFFPGGPCMPNPCKNDGICSETTNSTSLHFCECSELYTGPNCEAEIIGNRLFWISLSVLHPPLPKMSLWRRLGLLLIFMMQVSNPVDESLWLSKQKEGSEAQWRGTRKQDSRAWYSTQDLALTPLQKATENTV